MKLVILSDSHGNTQCLRNIFEQEKDANAFIYLGDGLRDIYEIQEENPTTKIYTVRGNCDLATFAPSEATSVFGGFVVFFTHGDGYDVKRSKVPLRFVARERGADIVLFGHTHTPFYEYDDGLYLFNPGCCALSYGVLTITNGKVHFEHREP